MAQADRRDGRILSHGAAQARQWIAEVDEQSRGAEALHLARDIEDVGDIARGVREAARPPILAVRLAQAMAERRFPISTPQLFARPDLDRTDDEIGALQQGAPVGVALDGQASVPCCVHPLG